MIPSMYAKLFSRIAQSSLMEEDVEVRYCFMMLLAIADSTGDVIGTDIALARTVNLPLDTFRRCIAELMEPDPDSNSQVFEGRRIVSSENGRGYRVVNYITYRQIKTNDEKRAYMREYMQRRRKGLKANDVTPCKTLLSDVTHSESEGESEEEADTTLPPSPPQAAEDKESGASLGMSGLSRILDSIPKQKGNRQCRSRLGKARLRRNGSANSSDHSQTQNLPAVG